MQLCAPDVDGSRVVLTGEQQLGGTVPPSDHILRHEVLLGAAGTGRALMYSCLTAPPLPGGHTLCRACWRRIAHRMPYTLPPTCANLAGRMQRQAFPDDQQVSFPANSTSSPGPGEPKVTNFEVAGGVEQQVAGLQVTVQHIGCVHILEPPQYLHSTKLMFQNAHLPDRGQRVCAVAG